MPRPTLQIPKEHLNLTIDGELKRWLVEYSIATSQSKSKIISDQLFKLKWSKEK